MVYFIGDTHFGHASILRFCDRPFSDVEEMNAILIANWNSRVREKDTVYILGDMFYHCEIDEVEHILRRLLGHKKLLVGNHDSSWMGKIDASMYFDDISLMMEESDGRHEFTLCHYPMLSWRRDSKAYMIHGHIHNDVNLDYWPVIADRDRIINAGVDVNGFVPVTFEEMVANNIQFKKRWREQNNEL